MFCYPSPQQTSINAITPREIPTILLALASLEAIILLEDTAFA